MRISGGDARGVQLKVPKGARPASERVRQAIFSSLGARVPGSRVLDLYCGSGAYGLEALSRGADAATFVDADPKAVAAARANASAAGYADVATVRRSDVRRFLERTGDRFDLVFADPPYGGDVSLPGALGARLRPGATVVVEASARDDAPAGPQGCILEADRRYGDTRVLVFRRGEEA